MEKPSRYHCLRILEWCMEEYGGSKYTDEPLFLEFRKPIEDQDNLLGEFDSIENVIYINSQDHMDLEDLCQTVIEEYGHYLQSDDEYQKLCETHTYETHPHEIETKQRATRDYKKCLSSLAKRYKRFR